MSIKNKYQVESIDIKETYEWLKNKHYAKRIPQILSAFGLYNKNLHLMGVCTYGLPPSSTLCESVAGKEYSNLVIELNRLCIDDKVGKNVLSYFVSKTLKMLKEYKIIVSFSDMNMNHSGYIYQATNFIYTGTSSNDSQLIDKDGNEFHFRNLGHYQKKLKKNINIINRIEKNLSDDLLKKEYLSLVDRNKYTGHCYIASECLYHLFCKKFNIYQIKHENSSHWFLKKGDNIIDITKNQFKTPVPYNLATRRTFLTKFPSKRTAVLMQKVINDEFKIVKKRLNEDQLDRVVVAKFLREHKGNHTASQLDEMFGYKDTAAHWFRLDKGFSYPSVDDWLKLKEILKFNDMLDNKMLDFEWIPDMQDIIKKLQLTKKRIKPKHRYIYIKGSKKEKKTIKRKLRYQSLPYPKGENKRYDASYKPATQTKLF